MKCWHCGAELIWGGDHDITEEFSGEYVMITNLSCPECKTEVDVWLPGEPLKESDGIQ